MSLPKKAWKNHGKLRTSSAPSDSESKRKLSSTPHDSGSGLGALSQGRPCRGHLSSHTAQRALSLADSQSQRPDRATDTHWAASSGDNGLQNSGSRHGADKEMCTLYAICLSAKRVSGICSAWGVLMREEASRAMMTEERDTTDHVNILWASIVLTLGAVTTAWHHCLPLNSLRFEEGHTRGFSSDPPSSLVSLNRASSAVSTSSIPYPIRCLVLRATEAGTLGELLR
ncbi:hypothetical protein RRG08_042540 [Elysia crispata]|uniref:Uncharacterized protein n=1 Tax=Elysia crispata TaxID=231223 RepID=A0AAE1CK97_9GAST|nr:hypothetical protein RRG08_042540 [Elysia crispata]